MTALILGGLSLAIWLGLIFAHHGFWLTRERDTLGMPANRRCGPMSSPWCPRGTRRT
jgi:hypothetical protein